MAEADATHLQPYRVVAFNSATEATNKIHSDDVARRLGFRGGLVPGVDVYAYLTHVPVTAWGVDWLARGAMRARFHQPVYDGSQVQIEPTTGGALELRDERGTLCAAATAVPPGDPVPAPESDGWPQVAQRSDPPLATPETLAQGTSLGLDGHHFRAERAAEYLDEVREELGVYAEEGVAHPGWLLRDANYVLSANVRLGPWIHVESAVQHHDLVRDGALVSARAIVSREWERKGHRLVELDVLHLADDRPVARTTHTAIYQPRGA